MTSTRLMRGARLGMENGDGLVRMGIEGESREIGKRNANEDGRRGDGGEGKKRGLRRMLKRKMG